MFELLCHYRLHLIESKRSANIVKGRRNLKYALNHAVTPKESCDYFVTN